MSEPVLQNSTQVNPTLTIEVYETEFGYDVRALNQDPNDEVAVRLHLDECENLSLKLGPDAMQVDETTVELHVPAHGNLLACQMNPTNVEEPCVLKYTVATQVLVQDEDPEAETVREQVDGNVFSIARPEGRGYDIEVENGENEPRFITMDFSKSENLQVDPCGPARLTGGASLEATIPQQTTVKVAHAPVRDESLCYCDLRFVVTSKTL